MRNRGVYGSDIFCIAFTEVNEYMTMIYLLKADDNFMNFGVNLDKAFINNSYNNEKKCDSLEKTEK